MPVQPIPLRADDLPPALPSIPGYRLISELGRGSSSVVYLAIQESMGRKVALKISLRSKHDARESERFLREARIIARLSHPYIVAVHDVGECEGRFYIAMEYLGGGNLRQRIRRGITADDAVRIVSHITQALEFAHDKGFLHRDIKPANILFRQDGSPVLTDFGIAHHMSASPTREAAPASSLPQTVTATVIGTPRYMSPEQIKGKVLDRRSDLYAVGILFYEMLTGKVPFDGRDALDIGIKHIKSRVPTLPADLSLYQPVVDKMLAKEADERFQRGQAFIVALQSLTPQGAVATPNVHRYAMVTALPSRRRTMLLAMALFLLVVALLLGQSTSNSEIFNRGIFFNALH